jgi:hypothetical protein
VSEADQKITLLEGAVSDLVTELAVMHGTLLNAIAALRATQLSNDQRLIVDGALATLKESQRDFFAKYADQLGGAKPGNN